MAKSIGINHADLSNPHLMHHINNAFDGTPLPLGTQPLSSTPQISPSSFQRPVDNTRVATEQQRHGDHIVDGAFETAGRIAAPIARSLVRGGIETVNDAAARIPSMFIGEDTYERHLPSVSTNVDNVTDFAANLGSAVLNPLGAVAAAATKKYKR